jgi:hypothetical protein
MFTRLAVAGAMVLCVASGWGGTVYVNGTTGSDAWSGLCEVWDGGTCGPKKTIQAGINVAAAGDVVQVADGTYTGMGNRSLDFGGKNITVRSANSSAACIVDCQGSGRAFYFHHGETPSAVLDGFTISNGHATGSGAAGLGGGVYCENSGPTIRNCIFNTCTAVAGGGLDVYQGSVTITGCSFTGNVATTGSGGGVLLYGDVPAASGTLNSCDFTANHAGFAGGGLAVQDIILNLDNCLFEQNATEGRAESDGGGVYVWYTSAVNMTSCSFSHNATNHSGGGAYVFGCTDAFITDCAFAANHAGEQGGGLYITSSDVTLAGCAFMGNDADGQGGGFAHRAGGATLLGCTLAGNTAQEGGGFCDQAGSAVLANCLFVNNTGMTSGGAVCGLADAFGAWGDAVLTNCTFAGNWAANGHALAGDSDGDALATITNCILWDGGDEVSMANGATVDIHGSILTGGWPVGRNSAADPLFVDPDGPDNDPATWEDNDYHISPESPAVDYGDNDAPEIPAQDFDGGPRIAHCRVDMGAYESPYSRDCNGNGIPDACDVADGTSADCNSNTFPDECDIASGTSPDFNGDGVPDECAKERRYVRSDAPPGGNGLSWGTAYGDLQSALWEATYLGGVVTEIWVAGGTYTPDGGTGYRGLTFQLVDGLTLYGGFAGWEEQLEDRDWVVNETILSGDLAGDDQPGFVNRSDNSLHVVTGSGCAGTAVLDGFAIRGGYAAAEGMYTHQGGGLVNWEGSPTLRNCSFRDNRAPYWPEYSGYGGAVFNYGGSPTFYNCTFQHNDGYYGGAMCGRYSQPTVAQCTFVENTASESGAVMNQYGSLGGWFEQCTFAGNTGGAVYNYESDPTFVQCTFTGNRAYGGAGMRNDWASPTLTDCLFAGNQATDHGGGVANESQWLGSNPTLAGCVFEANSAGSWGGGMSNADSCNPVLTACSFIGNVAMVYGGGAMYNVANAPLLIRCEFVSNLSLRGGGIYSTGGLVFRENHATLEGGAVYSYGTNDAAQITAISCIFDHNRAEYSGGALFCYCLDGASEATFLNCSLVGNVADLGSAVAGSSATPQYPAVINASSSIVYGDAAPLWAGANSAITVTYSDVQGNWSGMGNIDADPLLVDADGPDDIPGTADDDLHLQPGSPCINTGDPSYNPGPDAQDMDGEPRVRDCRVDMGADESAYPIVDCNSNGVADTCDVANGTSQDCDVNGIPDECEPFLDCNGDSLLDACDIAFGISLDCNGNWVPDECDIIFGGIPDCNGNGVPDECDLVSGFSRDCDANGVPDECDPFLDCNGNGIFDACDIADGASRDCNANGVPDECDPLIDCDGNGILDACDIADGTSPDCNGNGVPDECDIIFGGLPDCNGNGVPDECDVVSGSSFDCNSNGVPDECDIIFGGLPDCNSNGAPDECDLVSGFSLDCNVNGIPDECDLVDGTSQDANGNGIPDECEAACIGDLNCDGVVDFGDINPFVVYLSNSSAWQATYPSCDPRVGDMNCDGTYGQWSFGDINPFVNVMTQCGMGCPCPGPVNCR